MRRIEDSPLFSKIRLGLDELTGAGGEINTSLTPEGECSEAKDGDRSYVERLNWQIYDEDEAPLCQSELCHVQGGFEEATIEMRPGKSSPDQKSCLDNEIYLEVQAFAGTRGIPRRAPEREKSPATG